MVLASFWDPAGRQKSTKNGPGAEQVRPEMAPEAIFVVFSRRRRSESLSGPNFGGSDPHSVWPGLHGSHFSVFAKITEKVASGDQFWDQKWLKIDAGATQNRQKSRKKYIFDDPFFQRFFECQKKRKNAKKGRHLHFPRRGSAV